MPTTSTREAYEGRRRTLLAELPCAGRDVFKAAAGLAAHVHPDAYEICLIVSGSVDWWAGDTVHEVRGGALFVTRPAEPHGGEHAVMNPCELYWFHVRLPPRGALPGWTPAATAHLRRRLRTLRLRSFRASAHTIGLCEQLHAEHRRQDRYAAAAARAALDGLLISILRDHDRALHLRRDHTPAVVAAMAYIDARLETPFRIADVADAVGLHVGNLHKRFAAETGLSPGQWRTRQALTRAKAMLRGGAGVLDVSVALNFSSSQYFATAFRRVTGLTPRQYRAAAVDGKTLRHGPTTARTRGK